MEINTIERKKNCPRCLTVFSCCTENCWCGELPRIMPLSEHEDCLCYDCLKIEIENRIKAAEGKVIKIDTGKKQSKATKKKQILDDL